MEVKLSPVITISHDTIRFFPRFQIIPSTGIGRWRTIFSPSEKEKWRKKAPNTDH